MRISTARRVRPSVPSAAYILLGTLMLGLLAPLVPAQGVPGGFAEAYALATDRQQALAELVPGTEEHYFFHCLDAQHRGALDEVAPLLAAWTQRHGRTAKVQEIEARQALLSYDRDPDGTLRFLRERLGLQFAHQRQVPGAQPDLPTRLDPARIETVRLLQEALRRHPRSVDGLHDRGVRALVRAGVPDALVRPVLQRLETPDVPGLAALVVRELGQRGSGAFGSLPIHRELLQAQLDELAQQVPAVLDQEDYVHTYLLRLWPGADVDWRRDDGERQRYLERLEQFAQRLPPVHNGLKAHVLYHRLAFDLERGTLDPARLLAYLRLPRNTAYANPELLRRSRGNEIVSRPVDYPTGLGQVGDDEALVRTCLEQRFAAQDSFREYSDFVREDWLRRVFAETKILLGQGDMERWYSLLDDPAYYERLVQRVDLAFAPTQRRQFRPDETVTLALDVKNVPTLLRKVYRIDAYEYLRQTGKEVDASIDLDGVVANDERVVEYQEPPLRRVRREFELPELTGAGTWVVEFVGNGRSSRAVIQKGALTALERLGAAGHVFTVLDQDGAVVQDAVAFCAGREFTADERGEIAVPFAPEAFAARPLVLRRGPLATMQRFAHRSEEYSLRLGAFADRESLRPGRKARLLLRPQLAVQGVPIDLALLQDAVLEITATTRDGVRSMQAVTAPKWTEHGEYVHEFEVPRELASLAVTLRGSVRNLSMGRDDALSAAVPAMEINGVDATATIEQPLLGRSAEGWFVEVRGRTGEPIAGRGVELQLFSDLVKDPLDVALRTDADGRVDLGALDGIGWLRLSGLPAERGYHALQDPRPLPAVLQGRAGEVLRLPYPGRRDRLGDDVATLIERRGGAPFADVSARLALVGRTLELRDLPAGDYTLRLLESGHGIEVRVTAGGLREDWAVGRARVLRQTGADAVAIRSVAVAGDQLAVQLDRAGPGTRVHVFAQRYLPAFDPSALHLGADLAGPLVQTLAAGDSDFAAGRQLSDEMRYVLERRYATKYPGNMLQRPSLLLNPWALDERNDQIGVGGGAGGRFGGRSGGPSSPGPGARALEAGAHGGGAASWADLDFLVGDGRLLANLRADGEGRVRVPLQDLGPGQLVRVVVVDDDAFDQQSLLRPLQPLQPRDLTLPRAFDAGTHLAEQQRIDVLAAGEQARIADVATARVQPFVTLGDAHRLLQAATGSPDLAEFAFVTRWPGLDDEQKRALYKEHACHELHLFLYHKDRAFFDAVLRPYLADKAHKEFLDDWLLENDLTAYLEPWRFERLNLVERILLLRRLPARQEALDRYVQERGELLEVDLERQRQLFLGALRSGELDADAHLGQLMAPVVVNERGIDRDAEDRPGAVSRARLAEEKAKAPAPTTASAAEPEAMQPPAEREVADKAVGDDSFLLGATRAKDDARRRDQAEAQAFWRGPEPTRALVEHAYWHTPRPAQRADLIQANGFWRDFARSRAGEPFASAHLPEASGSFTEAMLALAVLDLPFSAEPPAGTRDGSTLTLQANALLLLARSELLPAGAAASADPVLIRQDCYRLDDRYAFDGNQRRQKPVADEFVRGVGYGSQVVLTNPTEVPRRLSVLLQIPAGALPLQGSLATRSVPVELGAFATATLELQFYWPRAGDFAHYPAQVAADGAFLAAADAAVRHVVDEPSRVDTASWEHVSQLAGADEVLAFLRTQNLERVDLERAAWRLRDRAFFDRLVALLRERLHPDPTVWSYALLHGDADAGREYLAMRQDFVGGCGRALRSPLLTIDAVDRRWYEHTEFDPLFHGRVHRTGAWQTIQNPAVAAQWQQCVDRLCYLPRLGADDWMEACYYLLLQGRTDAALAAFDRVERGAVTMALQYDYLAAYVAFFRAEPALAQQLAAPHRDHPVERWRRLFRAVLQQVDEIGGAAVALVDPDHRGDQQQGMAARAPALELAVDNGTVILQHRNMQRCELRYHRLDLEFAFSNSPFAQQGLAAVGWVEPERVDVVEFAAGTTESRVPLPAEFQRGNVVVEVRGGGLVRRARSLAAAMRVQTVESYGQLEVRAEGGAPLARVYVKCYARMPGGAVRFHKDGYTDLRGRFDYASVSDASTAGAERFALLVLSEQDGAVVREVAPPGR